MREERLEIDGIPVRIHDPGGPRGLLLFGHSGAQSKDGERVVRLFRAYAEQTGLAVVCIDAVDHGERKPAGVSSDLPPLWHSTAAARMVADWKRTADELAPLGPAVAYVGFSMGMIFGAPTVAAMPGIRAAVFGVGCVPTGGGIDDPPLPGLLLDAAAGLGHAQVLMLNVTGDEVFRAADAHAFFDAIPGRRKRLVFWAGGHADWPDEGIRHSVGFINEHTG